MVDSANGNGHAQAFDWAALEEFVPEIVTETSGNGHSHADPARMANWDRIFARELDDRRVTAQLTEIREAFGDVDTVPMVVEAPREHNYIPNVYKDMRSRFMGKLAGFLIVWGFSGLIFAADVGGSHQTTYMTRCDQETKEKCIEFLPGYAQGAGVVSLLEGAGLFVSGVSGAYMTIKGMELASERRRSRGGTRV